MTGVEICLIITGIIAIVGSFIFAGQLEKPVNQIQNPDQYTKEILEKKVNDLVDKMMDDKIEKTESQLDKLSSEKIMAVGNYSDNVLADINKNHEEVMFLFGMLNDKEKDVKNTIIDVENIKKSIKSLEKNQDLNLNQNPVKKDNLPQKEVMPKKNNKAVIEKALSKEDEPIENIDDITQFKVVIKDQNRKNKGVAMTPQGAKNKTNNNKKILDLYKKGKSSIDIAKELHLGIGEVRLVIDLFKNKEF